MSEAEAELANAKAEYQAMLEQMNSVSSSGPNGTSFAVLMFLYCGILINICHSG